MKPEFVIDRQGKKFCLYEGLLDQAHQEGLSRISTTIIQIPSDANGNVAIVIAEVETSKGTFSGIGDASPANVNRMIAPHILRMAETRSKARALRDAVNVGMVSAEELGPHGDGEDDDAPARPARSEPPKPASQAIRESIARESAPQESPASSNRTAVSATKSQLAIVHKLAGQMSLPIQVGEDNTADEVAEEIARLTRAFNARTAEQKKAREAVR